MKKLDEIDRLVEEAFEKIYYAALPSTQKQILTTLARKCAEINLEDFCLIRKYTVGDNIEAYNSRLRDGQVEEVKQEEKSPSLKYYPLFKYFLDEHNVMLLETDYQEIERLLNIQPREWWRDLKKGDKFMCEDGLRTYNGKYSCIDGYYFLYTIEEGEIGLNVDYCSPYTDPTQSFRSKLTPEMQVEFDKLMEGK